MSFVDIMLPQKVMINSVRREIEDVEIVTTVGGFETRNIATAQSVFAYDISITPGDYDDETIEAVHKLYKVCRGKTYGFRFRDWDVKNRILDGEVIGTGDGVETDFQITKSWTLDGQTHSRKVTRPVSAIQVFKDGAAQSAGFTVNYDTGVITFSAAPSNGVVISVDGSFDIPVRFDSDLEGTGMSGYMEQYDSLTLREIRE